MKEARNDTSLAIGQDDAQKGGYSGRTKERGKRSTLLHTRFCSASLHEQENIRNSEQPSYSRLKTSVTRQIDEMVRTRNFKARNERIGTGVVTKSQKGTKVSVTGKWENALSDKHMDSIQWETLAVSATEVIVDKKVQACAPAPNALSQTDRGKPSRPKAVQKVPQMKVHGPVV